MLPPQILSHFLGRSFVLVAKELTDVVYVHLHGVEAPPLGFAGFPKQPSAKVMTRVLERSIARAGAAPKYTVTDKAVQFPDVFKRWCREGGSRLDSALWASTAASR